MNATQVQQEAASRPSAEAAAFVWSDAINRLMHALSAGECSGRGAALSAEVVRPLLAEPRFAWLVRTFGLDHVDALILLIVAAPELETQIEPLYRSCSRRPSYAGITSTLCIDLLASSPAGRIGLRQRFAAEHALFQHRLLAVAHATAEIDPLRRGALSVDPQVLSTLLYESGIDPRLSRYCQLVEPTSDAESTALSRGQWRRLVTLAKYSLVNRVGLHLQFRGARGSGRRQVAEALAGELGMGVLRVDFGLVAGAPECAELSAPLFRQAWFSDALLYIEGVEALVAHTADLDRLLDAIADDSGITILATDEHWSAGPRRALVLTPLDFSRLEGERRTALWRHRLAERNVAELDVGLLSARFRLSPAQIDGAIVHAQRRAASVGAEAITEDDLIAAARAQAPQELTQLARKVTPAASWDDLVLPVDAQRQLRELCSRVTQRARVLEEWGFDAKLSLGKGTSALFAGASGTGKTMAAEIVAAELKLDLYKIDLAAIVSKYIGETEKNLDKVFNAARNANAVLLFDEADAIFGKRSEVRDSHDRYANLEIAYLLQKMEEYEGLAILSTNLKQNLDDAFLRRLTYTVLFPFPDGADRERIWRRIWPAAAPLETDLDFAVIAQRFKLSGGNIKNAALAAAYFAAEEGVAVGMRHVIHGVRRELQKAGKLLDDAEVSALQARAISGRTEVRVG